MSDGSARYGISALDDHLGRLAEVLSRTPAEVYADAKIDLCFGGTVGGHVRHVMDHVRNLLDGFGSGVINYEVRRRGDAAESSPADAVVVIASLRARASSSLQDESGVVRVSAMVSREGGMVAASSTLGREIVYVVDHTVHHMAMIRMMLERAGIVCPAGFGLAAGTPTAGTCAR